MISFITNTRGQWESGRKHGFGRDVLDGEANYYEGHFVNGLRDGHGILMFPSKNYSYEGAWHQDKMNGFGTLNSSQGSYYQGALVVLNITLFLSSILALKKPCCFC